VDIIVLTLTTEEVNVAVTYGFSTRQLTGFIVLCVT